MWTSIFFVVCISKHSKKLFPNPCGVNVILWFLFCGSATISVACIWMEWILDHASNKANSIDGFVFVYVCIPFILNQSRVSIRFFFHRVYCFSSIAHGKRTTTNYLSNLRQKWFVFRIVDVNNNKNERKQKLDREKRSIIQNKNEMTSTENNRKHFDSILIISVGFEMQRLDLKWALANGWFIRSKRWALASFFICIFIYNINATVSFRWIQEKRLRTHFTFGQENFHNFHWYSPSMAVQQKNKMRISPIHI